MPISFSDWPSKPPVPVSSPSLPSSSIQASKAATLVATLRSLIACSEKTRALSCGDLMGHRRSCRARWRRGSRAMAARFNCAWPSGAIVTNGRSPPTITLTRPSGSMRIVMLASTSRKLFGPGTCDQQACSGNPDFRLGRHRDRDAGGVAQHDVAQTQCRAALCIALELRAADLDAIAAAEILLDRRRQPGRERSSMIGPLASRHHSAPPQISRTASDSASGNGGLAHHRMPAVEHEPGIERQPPPGHAKTPRASNPGATRQSFCSIGARRRPGFHLGAPVRIERRLQFLERRDVQTAILVRHARSAVPSSAGLATGPLQVTLCRPTDSPGIPAVSHRTTRGRHWPPTPCHIQLDPVKTTKGRRMTAKIAVGGKAPELQASPRRRRRSVACGLQGTQARPLLLSQGRYPRLHRRGQGFLQARPRLWPRRNRDPRGFGRSGAQAGQVQSQARPFDHAGVGRNPRDAGGLWRLGQEIACMAAATWASFATPI